MLSLCCLCLLSLTSSSSSSSSSSSAWALQVEGKPVNPEAPWPRGLEWLWPPEGHQLATQSQKAKEREKGVLGEQEPPPSDWEEGSQPGRRRRLPEPDRGQPASRRDAQGKAGPSWLLEGPCSAWHGGDPPRCSTWVVKLSLVCALGVLVVLSNGTVIAIVASSVSGWSRSSRLVLLSLAVADAALAALVVPLNLYRSLGLGLVAEERARGGEAAYCRAVAFVNSSVFGASLYSLAGVSLERYVAVFFPLHYRRLLSPTRVALLIATAWLLPAILLAPLAVPGPRAVLRIRFSATALLCEPDYASNPAYSLVIAGTIFCPPAGLVTFANLRLWLAARTQRQRQRRSSLSRRDVGAKRASLLHLDAAARILLPVVVAFYLCWLPCILTVLYNALTQERAHEWVEFVSLWLPTGSGFLNCFIYFGVNRSFRHKFQRTGQRLCRPCCWGRRDEWPPRLPTLSAAVEGVCERLELPPRCSCSAACSSSRWSPQKGLSKV